ASPPGPGTVRKPLPHSVFSPTRRKSALICSASSFWSDTFFSVKVTVGTSLFWPLTMPRSYHPALRMVTCSPLVRSTVGPHETDATIARSSSSRTQARMRAILEHPHLNPLERLLVRNPPGQELAQIRTA